MKKILYVTPHLSTGGLPQYLCKKIENFITDHEIWCVEYSNYSDEYVVQKNKIREILGDKLITLDTEKRKILKIISEINPDIIHFEEIPETFIDFNILDEIYVTKRDYKILVTTHTSETYPKYLIYLADMFVLVSEWSRQVFKSQLGESPPCEIWEYPVELKQDINRDFYKDKLGFDKDYIHILNVGLFTPGKNQGEVFKLAEKLLDYKIKFHFVGNLAPNFESYWCNLIKNKPSNCIIHGERFDVEDFYSASDAFYFSSNFELNPLVVKEALSFNLPVFAKKLPTYLNTYDHKVNYINGDLQNDIGVLFDVLDVKREKNVSDSICLVMAHANTDYRKKLLNQCLESIKLPIVLSTNYPVSEENQLLCDYFIYSKNNPLLYKEEYNKYNVFYNYWTEDTNGNRTESPFDFEHGYAAYSLIREGLEFIEKLGYKKVHIINYDYQIDYETIINNSNLLDKYDIIIYRYDENENYGYCSGFLSSKLEYVLPFFTKFKTKDSYYTETYDTLENKLKKYLDTENENVLISRYHELEKVSKLNQEGVLQFSKSN